MNRVIYLMMLLVGISNAAVDTIVRKGEQFQVTQSLKRYELGAGQGYEWFDHSTSQYLSNAYSSNINVGYSFENMKAGLVYKHSVPRILSNIIVGRDTMKANENLIEDLFGLEGEVYKEWKYIYVGAMASLNIASFSESLENASISLPPKKVYSLGADISIPFWHMELAGKNRSVEFSVFTVRIRGERVFGSFNEMYDGFGTRETRFMVDLMAIIPSLEWKKI